MDAELLKALDALMDDDTMIVERCMAVDAEKRAEDMERKGYRVACLSTAGLPRGVVRLTFLKNECFKKDKP